MRRAGFLRLAVIGCLVWLAATLPAGAAPPAVSGSAYGASASSSLLGSLLGSTPAGVAGSATAPSTGFHHSGGVGPIEVPNVVSLGAIEATTLGTINAHTGSRTVTSTVTVASISIANGLVSAAAVTTSCTAGGPRGPTGSVLLAGLTIGGESRVELPAPNTTIGVPGVFSAVLNEQTPVKTPQGDAIQVRALDLEVLPAAPGGAILSVIVGEADCDAGGVLASPTRRPPRPLVAAAPASPVPSLSPAPSPAPTPTPSPAASPSTGPAVTLPPAAPPAPPARFVLSPKNGPPGSTLSALATRYSGCPKVMIKLGGAQLGSGVPSASGELRITGLAIPGDLAPGHYQIYARCTTSSTRRRVATFTVARTSLHRSAFVTSVITPSQVNLSPKTIGQSAAVAGGFLLVGAFPGELFNATLAENYDEIRGWFGLGPRKERPPNRWRELGIFAGFVLVGGVLDSALSPDFGLNRSTLALAIAFAAALVVLMLVYSLPVLLHIRSHHGEWGVLKVLPGTAVIAAACVVISRAVHFEPGYLLGLVAGLEFGRELANDTTGRLTLIAASLMLATGLAAWLIRTPVAHAASQPHAGFWIITLEAGLAALWVAALESSVFTLLPLRYLEGKKLTDWKWIAWVGIFAVATLAYIHILLQPSSGYVSPDAPAAKWTAIALFVGFGLFSVGFWAYFRFRKPHAEVARA